MRPGEGSAALIEREVLRAIDGRLYQVTLYGRTVEDLDRQEANWLSVVLPRMVASSRAR